MKKFFSIALALALAVACLFTLAACNKKGKYADNTEHYDTITKTLKLDKDFEGKDFLTDGIGKATLVSCTDGDTTNFRLASGTGVTIRYHSIDTPESTGGVEKWGVAASTFNKQQLTAATDFVLESTTGTRPVHDNYGVRWLGYVWYKGANDSDYKCLNLEMVENGYSENKGVNTDEFPYWSFFDRAEKFAKSIELRTWSQLDDPLYTTDPVHMTIKEFWDNTDRFFNTDNGSEYGAKVEFDAYITGLRKGSTGTYTFTAVEYYPETGETYTIDIYAGYSSNSGSKLKIGHLYNIIGTVQNHYGFQISGISYDTLLNGENFTTIKQANYYLTFDSSYMADFDVQYNANFYGDFTVSSATLSDGELTIVGSAKKMVRVGNVYADQPTQFTVKVNVPNGYDNSIQQGTVLKLAGLQLTANSGVINVLDFSDISVVS